ncbi:hypothetical protein C8F01DRAFT_103568 [Mycena amicta]|nr:hypothetical protein C8F01DRAFT_103568 [Mycena amicta]
MAVDLAYLFSRPDSGRSPRKLDIDAAHPVFARVTHLSLHDYLITDETHRRICAALPGMPSLTHLRLKLSYEAAIDGDMLRHILASCLRLEVLLLTSGDEDVTVEGYPDEDPRLVFGLLGENYDHFWDDWERGANGLVDLWTRAEDMVKKRKQTKLDNKVEWIYPNGRRE